MKKLLMKKGLPFVASAKKGFTLIEILVVIGIIAILATIVLIAINPARQFAQARNTQRTSGINSILNAIGQRIADNKGVFGGGTCPSLVPVSPATSIASSSIVTSPTATGGTAPRIDLSCLAPTYIPSMPADPDSAYAVSDYTGYDISVNSNGRVMVCASKAQETAITDSSAICVTR